MYKKVYRVEKKSDALAQIKTELGPEAQIIDERKVPKKGALGFLGKKEYEIIAIISREERERFLRRKQTNRQGVVGNEVDIPKLLSELQQKQAQTQSTTQSSLNKQASQMIDVKGPMVEVKDSQPSPMVEVKNDNYNIPPVIPTVNDTALKELDSEIKALKGMLSSFMEREIEAKPIEKVYEENLTKFDELMEDYEFSKYVREEFISFLKANEISLTEVTSEWVEIFVEEAIEQVLEVEEEDLGSKVKLFVGPPGVGKTTTIAKIAAIEKKMNKKRVALITVDEYRIGAVEQLKKYATILKAPLEVVKTKEKLEEALEKFSDYDLIIVDSTGRSQRDDENLFKMAELLDTLKTDDVYLVLSASSKQRELFKIMDEFEVFNYGKIVLTKVDENQRNELILNIAMEREYPFAYFCNGQNVPTHIEKATKERAIELILGEGDCK